MRDMPVSRNRRIRATVLALLSVVLVGAECVRRSPPAWGGKHRLLQDARVFRLGANRGILPHLKESPAGSRWLVTWNRSDEFNDESTPETGGSQRESSLPAALLSTMPGLLKEVRGLERSSRAMTWDPLRAVWWLRGETLVRACRAADADWFNDRYLEAWVGETPDPVMHFLDTRTQRWLDDGIADQVIRPADRTGPEEYSIERQSGGISDDDLSAAVEGLGYQIIEGDEAPYWSGRYRDSVSIYRIRLPMAGLVGATHEEPPIVARFVDGDSVLVAVSQDLRRVYYARGAALHRLDLTRPLPEVLRLLSSGPGEIPEPPAP